MRRENRPRSKEEGKQKIHHRTSAKEESPLPILQISWGYFLEADRV